MGRVVVFGSLNVDLVTRVDRFPKAGETLMGNSFAMVPGGKGANQALASARAGAATLMFGAVGEDKNAEIATELLLDAGVDMTGVKAVPTSTGTASIFIDNGGENFIAVVAGANGEVNEHFADEVISALHADDILLLQGEIPAASMIAVLKAAQEKGVVSLFNTAPIIAQTVELAKLSDVIICNETEFALLQAELGVAGSIEEAAQVLAKKLNKSFVVTLGAEGAIAVTAGGVERVASMKITPVDTVGAGDTFCGYFAAQLAEGVDIAKALALSAKAASIACLSSGAQGAIPTRAQVDAYSA